MKIKWIVGAVVVNGEERMMKYRRLAISAAVITSILASAGTALGDLAGDEFNGTVLDPAWTVSFGGYSFGGYEESASGWTYSVSGGQLVVTDVADPVDTNKWVWVDLTRPLNSLDDFQARMSMAYAGDSASTMQGLVLSLDDAAGNSVVDAEHRDNWAAHGGVYAASIAGGGSYQGGTAFPLAGSGVLEINRTGGEITVDWDGTTVLTGTNADLVDTLRLRFRYNSFWGQSFFGSESVDFVRVESAQIPAPGAVVLAMIGMGMIGWWKRGKAAVM